MEKSRIFEVLAQWNFWQREINTGIPRPFMLNKLKKLAEIGEVTIVSGVRRSGKSTLLLQFAEELIKNKAPKTQVLYVNFEDPRFAELDLELLNKIYEVYREKVNPSSNPFVFLDEVQKIAGWERFARALHERKEAQVFISGSNAQLLSAEFGTSLTGRHIDLVNYPLSFEEFLTFKGIAVKNELEYVTMKPTISKLLNEFLEHGGFPKVVLKSNPEDKMELLKTYFEDILVKDVAERHKIRQNKELKELAAYYLANSSNLHSINRISKFIELSASTIAKFSTALESAYLVFFVPKYSPSLKDQMINPKKVYCIDTGMRNAVGFRSREDMGKLMENAIFIELKRRKKDVYYWRDRYGYEVDFVIKDGLNPGELIQACWNLSDEKIKQRETRALFHAMEEFKLKNAIVITEEFETTETYEDKTIRYVPLTKWLLNLAN